MAGRKSKHHGLFGFCSGMIDNPNYEKEMNEYKFGKNNMKKRRRKRRKRRRGRRERRRGRR